MKFGVLHVWDFFKNTFNYLKFIFQKIFDSDFSGTTMLKILRNSGITMSGIEKSKIRTFSDCSFPRLVKKSVYKSPVGLNLMFFPFLADTIKMAEKVCLHKPMKSANIKEVLHNISIHLKDF